MRWTVWQVAGAIEGVLLARLIGLLFAVRPANPVFDMLLLVTQPLAWPWAWLDRLADQPRFGARLDLATVVAMIVVVVLANVWSARSGWRSRLREHSHG
jgi:hypothetical protein